MISAKQFFICAIIFIIQTCMVHSSCSVIQSESGSIYDMFVVNGSINYHKCWEILNPNKQKLLIRIEELYSGVPRGGIVKNFDPIDVGNLTIILNDENKRFTYESSYTGSLYTKSSIVEIHFIVNSMLIADNYITNFTLNFETIAGKSTCSQIDEEKGTISYSYEAYGLNRTSKCWEIFNPNNDQMQIHLKELNLGIAPSSNCNLTVVMKDDERTYTFWSRLNSGSLVTNSSKVEITFNVNSAALLNWYKTNFTLQFQKMFEINVKEDLSRAIALLRNQSPHLLNLRDNSLKALIALYLAGNATFDGTDIKEELLVRRAEMRITSSLRRKSVSDMELSTYINFLLITCNSPRHFASYDLIQQVLNHMEVSSNFTHPAVYLALCNANETWPLRALRDLQNVLNSRTGYAFLKDIQAFAIMAISCEMHKINSPNFDKIVDLMSTYIIHFQQLRQKPLLDGSFGSIHETAIAMQSLISTDRGIYLSRESRSALKYISKELNSSKVDFPALYLLLPVLNKKSLIDISERNCTGNPRNNEDFLDDNKRSKIEVPPGYLRYSLFIGDEKELIRTTTLRLPNNFTAFQVMLFAADQNNQYNFEWRRESGKMYVYSISDIPNDPGSGKFWLTYIGSNIRKPPTPYGTKSPEDILLKKGDHLIMWYKTASL